MRNFDPRDRVLYPPAETESDTVVLNDMWFDGLEDDPELKQDRQEGEAKLSFEDGYQGDAVVGLTHRIDIDRIFRLFLGIPEFLKPRIPPCGYKSKPWMHMNPYEIHFEHVRVKLPDGTYPTFILGITDHNIISCECCMYLNGLQGNHEVMSRVAYHLDEGLVEPWSALTLTYRTGRSRLWGRGSQDLGAVCCERP